MATNPGPRQNFPSRIVAIHFVGGGVLGINFKWDNKGDKLPSSIGATITGWPGGVDDVKMADHNEIAGKNSKAPVPTIENPYTQKMLSYWLAWSPQDAIDVQDSKTVNLDGDWVVDKATWWGVYKGGKNGQSTGSTLLNEEDARLLLYTGYNNFYGNINFDDFGVILAGYYDPNLHAEVNTPPPPDPIFFQRANLLGWSYHQEPGKPVTTYTREGGSNLVINLAKLLAAIDVDPQTKKKPNTYELVMKIDDDENANWAVSASAFKTGKTDNKNFGIDAKGKPTFDVQASVSGSRPKSNEVQIKITFKPPKVSLVKIGSDGTQSGEG